MYQMSVVIAQKEAAVADRLAHALKAHFRNVAIAHTGSEIHDAVIERRAKAAVIDLDLLSGKALKHLCHDFPEAAVVATHTAPDEATYKVCMEEGAAECCDPTEIESILRAIVSNVQMVRAAHSA